MTFGDYVHKLLTTKTNNMNYRKFVAHEPTLLGKIINSVGQLIEFYEHPIYGDDAEVICVCHELELAEYSGFFEIDDMIAKHGEYEPRFENRELQIG